MMAETRAQISFEYLLTVAFGVLLVIAAFLIALQTTAISDQLKTKMLNYRESVFRSLINA